MKLFQDCEIVRQHLRGHTAVTIVGNRAATADELVTLACEYTDSFGTAHKPMYFSGDGWQTVELPVAVVELQMQPEPAKAAATAKPAKAAAKGE